MHYHTLLRWIEYGNVDDEGPINFAMGYYCCENVGIVLCRACTSYLIVRAGYLICPTCDCIGAMVWPPIPVTINEITKENTGRQDWTDLPPASQQP